MSVAAKLRVELRPMVGGKGSMSVDIAANGMIATTFADDAEEAVRETLDRVEASLREQLKLPSS